MSEELEYGHDADGKSKEELEKEEAKEKVEEKTGVNAEELAEVSREVLKTRDNMGRGDGEEAQRGIENVYPGRIAEVAEKMQDHEVAENIVKAGLGSEHTSTGSTGLEDGVSSVLEAGRQYSAGSKMGDILEQASNGGRGLNAGQEKETEQRNEKPEKDNNSELFARMAQKRFGR